MFPPHPFTVAQMGSSSLSTSTLRREERGQFVMRCLHIAASIEGGLGMNPSVGPALAADRVDHVSLSQFWLRLKGHRNKTAGFFVELVEITLSSTKRRTTTMPAQPKSTSGPRVMTVRELAAYLR